MTEILLRRKYPPFPNESACICNQWKDDHWIMCTNEHCVSPWWHFTCAGLAGISHKSMQAVTYTCPICIINYHHNRLNWIIIRCNTDNNTNADQYRLINNTHNVPVQHTAQIIKKKEFGNSSVYSEKEWIIKRKKANVIDNDVIHSNAVQPVNNLITRLHTNESDEKGSYSDRNYTILDKTAITTERDNANDKLKASHCIESTSNTDPITTSCVSPKTIKKETEQPCFSNKEPTADQNFCSNNKQTSSETCLPTQSANSAVISKRNFEKGRTKTDLEQLQNLLDLRLTITRISRILRISRQTVLKLIKVNKLHRQRFSSLTDPELDNNVTEIIKNHCCIAENVIKEHLLNRGISVQRKRLRASIHRFKDLQYEKPVLPPKRTKPGSSVSRQTPIPRKESNKGISVKSEVIEDIS